ncbi:MAG: carbon-nitrogen hydrolase family protein [Acidimicrobiia bacterium]|nr:carbon-nitrogen hydrolase family protein [Acidimicrobiia bacterium]
MADEYPVVRGAAVQAAPVFLDREATTEKACSLIREAGSSGARIIAFPEGFIPAHPLWFHFHSGTGAHATRLSVELFKNSVEIPGRETAALGDAARDADAYVVMGLCEKAPGTFGSMFNTQLFIGPDGSIIGKHQKLVPTVGERLVHRPGGPEAFGAVKTEFGPISGLMCGENSNPLAVFALTAENTRVHAMAWPNHFPKISVPMADVALTMAKAFAQMSKAFVLSAAGIIDDRMRSMLSDHPDDLDFLHRAEVAGGSVIVAPDTRLIAGPLYGDTEGVVYGDMDFELGVKMKLRHDLAGHYNRPDVFRLLVNRNPAGLVESGGDEIETMRAELNPSGHSDARVVERLEIPEPAEEGSTGSSTIDSL